MVMNHGVTGEERGFRLWQQPLVVISQPYHAGKVILLTKVPLMERVTQKLLPVRVQIIYQQGFGGINKLIKRDIQEAVSKLSFDTASFAFLPLSEN
jgi:hypothetical protein